MTPFVPFDGWSYSLLLGFYLGDGCVSWTGRSHQLRVILDCRYPDVIEDCVMAMTLSLRHEVNVHVRPRKTDRGVIVEAAWKQWPRALPQHGPGRKHNRPIVLADWQRRIVDAHPQPFLRGLIHSDGCRTINRFNTKLPSGRVGEYEYPRYFFSILSPDIRGLFCEYCDELGIRWTQSNPRTISVSHRDSVALLDTFVGPKT